MFFHRYRYNLYPKLADTDITNTDIQFADTVILVSAKYIGPKLITKMAHSCVAFILNFNVGTHGALGGQNLGNGLGFIGPNQLANDITSNWVVGND